jgi:hypothetical protein
MKVNKRRYISPNIETHHVDQDISLLLMTDEGTPPDGPRGAAAQSPEGGNTFEENPFEESSLK